MSVRTTMAPVSVLAPALGLAPVAILALALGCNAGGGDDGFNFATESAGTLTSAGSGSTAADSGSSGSDTTTSESADDETGDSSSGGGEESSTGEPLPPGEPCTAIDMIFVVDNSDPMLEEQIRLRSAAAAFVQMVQASVPTLMQDIHIGVVTTDDELFVQPSGMECMAYEGGNTWMLGSSTMLQAELDCALNVGASGSPNERPMDMLIDSLSIENLQPEGFHNGFLREDALLVVVVATNEEDEFEMDTSWGSSGDPPDWVAAIADRKGGFVNNIVTLSLLGIPKPNQCPDFQWDGTEGAQVSPRLIEFTESFPQGAVGDICSQEYASFLLGVVPGVAAACAAYIPP